MAKVKGPLFSLEASGKLADSLVYMNWKGIQDVRQWLIPANPRTAKQQTQRGYLTDAVNMVHTTAFNQADRDAWDLFASTLAQVMSGFNALVKSYINAKVAGKDFTPLYGCEVSGITSSGFTVTVYSELATDVKLYYGTSKTVLGSEVSGTYESGTKKWTFTLSGLSSAVKYYFQVKSVAADDEGKTGIYSQVTS